MCALVWFLPGVSEVVVLQSDVLTERLFALWAVVRFLPCVNEGVLLQIVFSAERLVTLWTIVFDPTVRLLVTQKVALSCKCPRTHITR